MLSIRFYSHQGQNSTSINLSDELYLWLAQSEFSKIGQSHDTYLQIDEEEVCLPLVELNPSNRQQFKNFFYQSVVQESDWVLTQLGEYPSKELYQSQTYRLRKLQELRKCIENENYNYLERV